MLPLSPSPPRIVGSCMFVYCPILGSDWPFPSDHSHTSCWLASEIKMLAMPRVALVYWKNYTKVDKEPILHNYPLNCAVACGGSRVWCLFTILATMRAQLHQVWYIAYAMCDKGSSGYLNYYCSGRDVGCMCL